MLRSIVAAAAASLCLAGSAAAAADIPGDTSTRAAFPVGGGEGSRPGRFEGRTDADWYRTRLTAGQTYTSRVDSSDVCAVTELRDAKGRLLVAGPPTIDYPTGWEFTALRTGTYYVAARRCDPPTAARTVEYRLWLTNDCARSEATTCVARVPGTTGRRNILFYPDYDWWKASLTAGRSYTIVLHAVLLDIRVRDSAGPILARAEWDGGGLDDPPTIAGFVPARSGTYYLEVVSNEDKPAPYTIEVRQP